MNIHEFQAKEILKRYGVPVPRGAIATTAEQAKAAAQELGGGVVVVKAQIHAGGRGKGGGVKVVRSPEEAAARASEMLGKKLVTHQTGPEGREVRRVLIEEGLNISRELYLAMVLDRAQSRVAVIASSEGGVEIEQVVETNPEQIFRESIDPVIGISAFLIRSLAGKFGLLVELARTFSPVIQGLYKAFEDCDASLAEINPLVITQDSQVLALDAKMNFDSNAFFRQPAIVPMRDLDEEDPREVEASK